MNGLTGIVADLYNALEPDIRVTVSKGKTFTESKELLDRVKAVEGVKLVSRSLSDKVLLKHIDKQSIVMVKGVDRDFNKVTVIDSAITDGYYGLNDGRGSHIVLGRGIATQLDVNMNTFVSELSLFSPVKGKIQGMSADENLNQVYTTPSGIFSLNDELDHQYAFIDLKTARILLDAENQLSSLEIACEPGMTEEVQEKLGSVLGPAFIVKNRYQLNDVLFKSLETEKLATFIILAFILVIATFNIIGTLTMLIIEKKKDMKTLYALGADQRLIRNIFMREAFLICGIGALAGLLLGLLVCWAQIQFHLVGFGDDFVVPYYPIVLQLKDFAWIFSVIMLIGLLAAIYPVRVFTRMDLVKE